MLETKKCLWCGVEFEPRDKRQKHCSKRCGDKMRYEERKGDIPLKYCVICGSQIRARGEHRKTCGKKSCISEQRKRYKLRINLDITDGMTVAEVRSFFGMRKIDTREIVCLCCGKVFCSEDIVNNKMCHMCREHASRYHYTDHFSVGGRKR